MIRPEDARKLNEVDQAAVAVEEARIDRELRAWDDGKVVTVDVSKVADKVRTRLFAMYREAGWYVDLTHGDQREPGVWFTFDAPKFTRR